MRITASYTSKCHACGGAIRPGSPIDWNRETRRATHVICHPPIAGGAPVEKAAPSAPALIRVEIPEGSDGHDVGRTYRTILDWREMDRVQEYRRAVRDAARGFAPEPALLDPAPAYDWLTVVRVTSRTITEAENDTREGETQWTEHCRRATDEEIAIEQIAIDAARSAGEAKAVRAARLSEIAKAIQATGDRPTGPDVYPYGLREIKHERRAHFRLGAEWVWYLIDNGADGDDWGHNNLPGTMGWRVAADSAPALALAALS